MEKVWLKNYQKGVPDVIDPDSYGSLNELFEAIASDFSQRPAFTQMNTTLTYQEIEAKSRDFAAYLQVVLQLKKGDRVALMLPNVLQYPVALFGILRAGLTVMNVNPLYTPRELARQLKDSGCETILVLSNFAHTVESVLDRVSLKNILITEIGDCLWWPMSFIVNWTVKYLKRMIPKFVIQGHICFRAALAIGKNHEFNKPEIRGEDIAFLQYTGGTTGMIKGARLTHKNMVANSEQTCAWIKPEIKLGEEIIITALPLYHIFSLTANCLTFMRIGALNVLIPNPRDIKGFIQVLKKTRFTAITGVNTLFSALLNQPAFLKLNFRTLKIALGGGMSIQHSVAERWKKVTGKPIVEAYGLTEASPAVCINPLNLQDFNGSIGLPISSTEISIRNDQGEALGCNTVGELWIRGPQVMKGYWQNDPETSAVLRLDGWLQTGDIATVDEQGFVRMVDRKKDLILISGFNVYPNEVEEVIALMEAVTEVAVIGVQTADGEKVKAFIVSKDPTLTKAAVIEHCRKQLTGYKIPKEIEFRSELPKSNVGKILKRVLRDEEVGI